MSDRTHKYKGINNVFNIFSVEKLIKNGHFNFLNLLTILRKLIAISLLILGTTTCFSQVNLDFEKWSINYNAIDGAKHWLNTSDATKYGAPTTLFKEVENPASGLAYIKLTTTYWKDGSAYQLDTLVGSIVQQSSYNKRPESFNFSYKSAP